MSGRPPNEVFAPTRGPLSRGRAVGYLIEDGDRAGPIGTGPDRAALYVELRASPTLVTVDRVTARQGPDWAHASSLALLESSMPELELGREFAGYRIEGVLGRGGMGVVYAVTDLRLERTAALKMIRPELSANDEFRRRFHRESQLAASIRQRNVVTIYHAGEAEGVLYITMERVAGVDLGALIRSCERLAPSLACELLIQIADALDAAHGRGLVHRDVKPANVLVEDSAPVHAYLTDFGLTKRSLTDDALLSSGVFLGTVDYSAPEQIKQEAVDARADVYALGCLLFAMLTGVPPFRRENLVATMFAHVNDPPPHVSAHAPNLPEALDPVIERALAKTAEERYSSAGEFARHVRRTLDTDSARPAVASFTFKPVESDDGSEGGGPRREVFLCYARADGRFPIDRIRVDLGASGQRVWIDLEGSLPGARSWERVRRRIEGCDMFVFTVSPDSVASDACREQLEEAVSLNKRIIALVHREVGSRAFPPELGGVEVVLLRESDDYTTGLTRLAAVLLGPSETPAVSPHPHVSPRRASRRFLRR